MTHESRPVHRAGSSPATTYKLFSSCYPQLLSVASDDPRLRLPEDAALIFHTLERQLLHYDGPANESAFIEWATPLIVRLRDFHGLLRENEHAIRGGIWRVLCSCSDLIDTTTVNCLTGDVALWIWENLSALLTPGTAKISTRLNQRAFWTAKAWRTETLRQRARHAEFDDADLLESGSRYTSGYPDRSRRKKMKKVS